MGRKFLLKKEQIGTWWKVNYVMHTNNKHEYTPILFLPTKRQTKRELKDYDNDFWDDNDFWIMPISVLKNTLEAAEKVLLNTLNNLDQNLFTWR